MADMTLQELRDQIASLEGGDSRRKAWVAALDAHLAGMGEPVAWLAADGSGRVIDVKAKSAGARASATASATSVYSIPLYAAPPIDIAAVREVIAGLRTNADDLDRIDVCPMLATHLRNGADKLEAAIKGGA
jgi:hypothetical protein